MTIVYVALIAGCVLGWHNLRTGKADLRGATRLSVIYFACLASAKLLVMHHTATIGEINGFWTAIGSAMVNGAIIWIFYVALEPWVRRKWPRTMISWTRYTSTGASDPLVGRDLLYGTALGALLTLGNVVDVAFHGNNRQPVFPPLDALLGVRAELSGVIASVRDAIFTALLFFFMLFLLRLLLRKEWIAGAAFVVIVTFASQANTTTPWVDYPLGALAFAIFAVALLRFGLLAAIVTSAVGQILDLGGMLDFSAWYSGMAFMPILLIVLVLVYGFRVSLGGRKLLKQEL
jgi:serine/threonine-protein kinase